MKPALRRKLYSIKVLSTRLFLLLCTWSIPSYIVSIAMHAPAGRWLSPAIVLMLSLSHGTAAMAALVLRHYIVQERLEALEMLDMPQVTP